MVRLTRTILQSSVTHVLFAFCVMGSWAVYANWSHTMPKPIYAGVVQGMMSATITYGLKRVIEALQTKFQGKRAVWAPPLVACTVSLSVLAGVHTLLGTPEVVNTISLPFTVAATYAATYNYMTLKHRGIPRGE